MYQVLYRKWRPKVFDDVSGQRQVTVTLKNELQSGRINHAYLFTGSRGTGKTTCAKILAKAVNCLNPVDGNPCGRCEICRGIDEGTVLDISEIDAASNNGVDNIRSIIDEAAFTPAKAKYRVYIIDEVHMLSPGAFNALLKTLEEPPAHVVFILATTEVHKLPATILSRCQRFDFHRIAPDDIADRLIYVAEQENVKIERDAALLIAAVSDGAMRDALSLMDRCIGVDSNITSELVRKTAGLAGREHLFEITDSIIEKKSGRTLDIIESLHSESKDMARLCEELCDHFRSLMLIKSMKSPKPLIIMSDDEFSKAVQQSKAFSLEEITFAMDTLQNSYDRMFRGGNKRTEMELALIKLSSPELDQSKEAILSRLAKLERAVKNGLAGYCSNGTADASGRENTAQSIQPENIETLVDKSEQVIREKQKDYKQEPAKIQYNISAEKEHNHVVQSSPKLKPSPEDFEKIIKAARPMEDWPDVLDVMKNYSQTIAASFKDTQAYISGDYLLIDAKSDIPFRLLRQSAQRDKMRVAVKEITGRTYKLGPYKRPEEKKEEKDPLDDFTQKVKSLGIELTEVENED